MKKEYIAPRADTVLLAPASGVLITGSLQGYPVDEVNPFSQELDDLGLDIDLEEIVL